MGTRNLIVIYYNGQYILAQYNQWDGYPEGQGVEILKFFLVSDNLPALKGNLHLLRPTINDRIETAIEEDELITWNYDSLNRDTGAKILNAIAKAKEGDRFMVHDPKTALGFAMDFLFCEWMYVLDLDANKLEVWSGGEPIEGARSQRFIGLWEPEGEFKRAKEEYRQAGETPLFLIAFELGQLPEEKGFVKQVMKAKKGAEPDFDFSENEDDDEKDIE